MGSSTQHCPLMLSCRGCDEFGAWSGSRRVWKWRKIEPSMTLVTQWGNKCLENEIFKIIALWIISPEGRKVCLIARQSFISRPEYLGLLQHQGPILPGWSLGWRRTSPWLGATGPMCTHRDNSPGLMQQKPAQTQSFQILMKPLSAIPKKISNHLELWIHFFSSQQPRGHWGQEEPCRGRQIMNLISKWSWVCSWSVCLHC